jgi:3-phenylpropionate/trans-cinnamate dioxygenase ferredoxin component
MTEPVQTKHFIQVAKTSELREGTMKEIKVGEHEVFLARVKDKFYAADNICPHMGGKLGRGKLEGTVVTCPRHASRFDLTDGRVIRWTEWSGIKASVSKLFRAPRPIITFPVKVDGDNILIEM